MQEAVKIEEMGIEDLIERYHIGEEENPYGVSYGEGMVVSHDYIPINIKEKPEVFNHPIRTKFSILFLCTKGNITVDKLHHAAWLAHKEHVGLYAALV